MTCLDTMNVARAAEEDGVLVEVMMRSIVAKAALWLNEEVLGARRRIEDNRLKDDKLKTDLDSKHEDIKSR